MLKPAPAPNTGLEFDDADVAQAYRFRPPYPDTLFARLSGLAPRRGRLLDLGCGPGKLARALADRFDVVTAIDPSTPMIAAGRDLDAGRHPNIDWVCASAEEADFGSGVDLAVAGASLHWMRHDVVFPKLCEALAPGAVVAAVGGDGPTAAAWLPDYRALIAGWIERLGFVFDGPEFRRSMTAHEAWIDTQGRETFSAARRMPIDDLIEAEHSRATWSRAKLGPDLAAAFDDSLRAALAPHAENGTVAFEVETQLLWGRPRSSPRP